MDGPRKKFVLYENANGTPLVRGEIAKARLTEREAVRLDEMLARAEAGALRRDDADHLRGQIWELRLRGDRRIFRLLYATVDDGLVLLGLVFIGKKTQKAPPAKIDAAEDRLKEYLARREHGA